MGEWGSGGGVGGTKIRMHGPNISDKISPGGPIFNWSGGTNFWRGPKFS